MSRFVGGCIVLAVLLSLTPSALAQLEQAPADAPNPPATLLGQTPHICNDGVPFALQIVEVNWTKQLGSGAGSTVDGAMWVTVVVSATNASTRNENLYRATQLRDERGRAWGDIAGTASAVHTNYAERAIQFGAQVANSIIRPGVPTRVLLVYSVAEDAQRLELISLEGGC
jgi:hypothetical protein